MDSPARMARAMVCYHGAPYCTPAKKRAPHGMLHGVLRYSYYFVRTLIVCVRWELPLTMACAFLCHMVYAVGCNEFRWYRYLS